MKNIIYLIFLSILCFAIGFLSFSSIETYMLKVFKNYDLTYSHLNTQFLHKLAFSFICSILPIGINTVWRTTSTEKGASKFISLLLFYLTIGVFFLTRYSILKTALLSQEESGSLISISFENLNFPLYIFIAEILGFVVMYLFLKYNKSKA
ncbi:MULTISPECIES: hypothetical protein [unclassified Sphingobacterium]|uniref:hypothetical protein n=1 Tax=unclassified Sphingobacterium TaxID=2609468 RepID=UPI00104A3E3E|nr:MULTISPECIES: hypothetical protein [unclassified Sphingobacterium]MCS3556175.1 uncharacterized BrkB/YihY/UPF0761 family membrane protein [Sphingobacterium sp. JUb21]